MGAIKQNRTSKGGKGPGERRVRSLATTLMSLLIVVALGATGCSISENGQTQTKVKPVVGSTHQNGALRVRIDSLCWSWQSTTTPMPGEMGAFTIVVEMTIKNVGMFNLNPPQFSVDGNGSVSWYPAFCRDDIAHNQECKLCLANMNQVNLVFNNNDPGKEILLTVKATDKWGKSYTVSLTLPPPLGMPRCSE